MQTTNEKAHAKLVVRVDQGDYGCIATFTLPTEKLNLRKKKKGKAIAQWEDLMPSRINNFIRNVHSGRYRPEVMLEAEG